MRCRLRKAPNSRRRVGRDLRLRAPPAPAWRARCAASKRTISASTAASGDLVVRHLEPRAGDQVRVADGDAARHARRRAARSSRLFSLAELVRDQLAAARRAPPPRPRLRPRSVIAAPLPAASIITPMMLFAFTRRPLRDSQTSHCEAAGDLGELGRGARVQAELVDDLYLSACHHGPVIRHTHRMSRYPCSCAPRPRRRLTALSRTAAGSELVAVGERADQHRQVTPETPSTRPGSEQASGDVAGRGAEMSVSTSTPSPSSSWRTSSRACGRIASGSSCTARRAGAPAAGACRALARAGSAPRRRRRARR